MYWYDCTIDIKKENKNSSLKNILLISGETLKLACFETLLQHASSGQVVTGPLHGRSSWPTRCILQQHSFK